MSPRRSSDELRQVDDPAWPKIEELLGTAPRAVQILDVDESRCDVALEALQVTAASFLGGIVGNCAGLLIDHGWLQILGAGALGLPGVHEANQLTGEPPPQLTVAWDVLGGQYAINGGGVDAAPGEVCYWAPDTLDWLALDMIHSAFVAWTLSDHLGAFYANLRWPGWELETAALQIGQGLSIYPPPFTTQGRDIASASRKPVPMTELHRFLADMAHELADLPDGSTFNLNVTES